MFPTSFQAARKTQIWFVPLDVERLSAFVVFTQVSASSFCPVAAAFNARSRRQDKRILNEIRKKWSLRDDFPMSAIYARGSSGGGADHSRFSENRVAPSIDARLARGLRAVDRDDNS